MQIYGLKKISRKQKKETVSLDNHSSVGILELWSDSSDNTVRSNESSGVRQPARNKIKRHNNNRLFNKGWGAGNQADETAAGIDRSESTFSEDSAELSTQVSAPGVLRIFGHEICKGANYKSVLATPQSKAQELVKEALERYSLEKAGASKYVLCDVIGYHGEDHQWKTECFRIVGDNEKPLMLQALWKPKEGFSRRFEIHKRSKVEAISAKEEDTITAGINAQARKLQKVRARGASVSTDEVDDSGLSLWRSVSEIDLHAKMKDSRKHVKSLFLDDTDVDSDKDGQGLATEKEETESSDDHTTQYSIHPPFEVPYFLLLQGYNYKQDFVIYMMSGSNHIFGQCSAHTTGDDEERLKVDILLSAPDILPQHCCVKRIESASPSDNCGQKNTITLVRPLQGAYVTHNGLPIKTEAELFPGDLLGLGEFYLFMYKDPTASSSGQKPTWLSSCTTQLNYGGITSCRMCGSALKDSLNQIAKCWHQKTVRRLKNVTGKDLELPYALEHEDLLLNKLIKMTDTQSCAHKLTPAFLLSLCIQHSASSFELPDFRKLLLRIASQIQGIMWERTKELAGRQPENVRQDAEYGNLLSIDELIPGLQPLVFWMSNSIELLHFIQQEVPKLMMWQEDDLEVRTDSLRPIGSASEEAVTVLEEVIMFTFQQSVYYLTKTLYTVLPGMLDSNPFTESGQLQVPKRIKNILDVFQKTMDLLTQHYVHTDITSQLFAYLFFFSNASLFNALMERGSGGGFYQWSKGVQIRANLDLLLDWIQGIELGDLAAEFFQKLSAAVNLLATPKENLLQASWRSLRNEFQSLKPAQLHHMLREYNPGRPCPPGWAPTSEDKEAALRTAEILESFDNHPPLILPSKCFYVQLGKPINDQLLLSQLKEIQGFLQSLAQQPMTADTDGNKEHKEVTFSCKEQDLSTEPKEDSKKPPSIKRRNFSRITQHFRPTEQNGSSSGISPVSSRQSDFSEAILTQKLKNLELQNNLHGGHDTAVHKRLALDPSCLLTPPNTPQTTEMAEMDTDQLENPSHSILNGQLTEDGVPDSDSPEVETHAEPFQESSEGVAEEDEVFTVELEKGDHGLGLALVNGLKTPLNMSGIYIKLLIPDSPAARCNRLSSGDRILAVNGTSLVGLDYHNGREIIRSAGDKLRLLVARSESEVAVKVLASSC
ncbi:ras-associating and dilute domain-containing protein-like isoform X2 [Protopterus annectens]|uniref:ras-associating and dilute domain-containing protein-like isoform X2 n=1 Tax=Protopterus annectens TaxID=7888 RepID=UPI001CFB55EC|nr:ras-associating and dilute domain-containing protein-like isoform X2 [Protopterus annectens]